MPKKKSRNGTKVKFDWIKVALSFTFFLAIGFLAEFVKEYLRTTGGLNGSIFGFTHLTFYAMMFLLMLVFFFVIAGSFQEGKEKLSKKLE